MSDDEDDEALKVLARTSDPITSHLVAMELTGTVRIQTINDKIIEYIRKRGPVTQREVCMGLNAMTEQPSITPRFARLKRAGLIREFTKVGHMLHFINEDGDLEEKEGPIVQTKKNPKTKKQAILWEVVPDEEIATERAKYSKEDNDDELHN